MTSIIDNDTYTTANQKLPDIDRLTARIAYLSADFISVKFKPDSNSPVAATCLQDTSRTLREARYALLEAIAHKIWHLEKSNPPNELAAVFFGRFYVDDAALRLYSAAEHLAKAIVYMFDISDDKLKDNRKGAGSRFVAVKKIMVNEQPATHPVTMAINELYNSSEWKKTICYRDTWVHNQPPIVKGQGMVFKRESRWKHSETDKSYKLGLGSGDEAEYSIDDLLGFIQPALFQFTDKLTIVIEYYIQELEKKGITIGKSGLTTHFKGKPNGAS